MRVNIFGQKIQYKPFYQTCLKVWRKALFVDGELDIVFESKQFSNRSECQKECDKFNFK